MGDEAAPAGGSSGDPMDFMTVSLGVTVAVAAVSYAVSHFYLWGLARLSQQDIFVLSFLIWNAVMNVLMGGSYVFLGGATGSIPLLSDLWKDYSAMDSRFAVQNSMLMALQAMSLFVLAPGSIYLAYSMVTGDKIRPFLQPVLSTVMIAGSLLLVGSEAMSGFYHLDMHPVALSLYTLSQAPYIIFPSYLLRQSYMVTMGTGSFASGGNQRGGSTRRPSRKNR